MSAVLRSDRGLAFADLPLSPLAEVRPIRQAVATGATLLRPTPLKPPAANRSTGLIIVVGLHLLLAWALASGLARKAVEIVKRPIEMVIVPQDLPPPPPPPKVEKVKDLPKPNVPPPSYVPPPEVVAATAPAPVIQAVQQAAPPPPAPVVAAAPPAAPPAEPPKPAVVQQEVAVACPGYKAALANVLEEAYERIGTPGTVTLLLKIKGNRVVDVVPQSGPKAYYPMLSGEIKRTVRCSATGDGEVQALLPVVFQG